MAGRIVSPELVGRASELEALARLLDDAEAGRPRTALIGGEAGIGKSRLLAEVVATARRRGFTVLAGGSVGLAEGSLPFAPIVEALRPLIRATDDVRPEATDGERPAAAPIPSEALAAARAVAVELGIRAAASGGTDAAELRPEWARSRLYEAVLELLRRLADDAPVALAIEDLHWSDDSTRELLAFLVRNLRDERLLLAVSFRSDELHRRHPLLPWLAQMDRASGVERIELRRLERAEVARQLAAILGTAPGEELTETVFHRSEGNPFYAEELLAAGAGSRRLPPTLREVLAARLAHVSDATLRVLGVAAIAGRRVDHELLAEVADIDEDRLLDALREATAAQLLVADEDALAERYAFRHALVGEAAAEAVLPGERRRLHVAIASALEAAGDPGGAERAVRLGEIAHHWFEAREPERAFAASLAAGEAAFEAHAYAVSLRQLERALELWDLTRDSEGAAAIDRIELLRSTARSAQLAGEYGRARAHLAEAIDALDPDVEPARLGVLHERLGRAFWTEGRLADALVHYARAVELVPASPPSVDRARVLAGQAQAMMLVGRHAESERTGEEARTMARALGNRQIEGHAATTVGSAKAYRGHVEAGLALGREGLELARSVDDHDDIGRAYANLATTLDLVSRFDEAIALSREGAVAMRRVGLATTYGAFNLLNAADGLFKRGRWAELEEVLDEVLPIGAGVAGMYGQQVLARLLVARGEFDRARAALQRSSEILAATADAQFNGPFAQSAVELAAWTGDLEGGRAAADRGLAILDTTEDVDMVASVVGVAMRLEADAAERARAARDGAAEADAVGRASELRERLDQRLAGAPGTGPLADQIASRVRRVDAELARARGEPSAPAWLAVLDGDRARGTPYPAAYAAWRAAEAMLAAGGPRQEAEALLVEAAGIAHQLGAGPLTDAVTSLAKRSRIEVSVARAGDAPSPDAPATGADLSAYDLTPREVEVLRLLALGRTNRQIAEELFISESTAGVHVSHILGKLGVGGRVEAAGIAVRLGLAG